jgi:hypothetical protein
VRSNKNLNLKNERGTPGFEDKAATRGEQELVNGYLKHRSGADVSAPDYFSNT